jgi:hypothetical protein
MFYIICSDLCFEKVNQLCFVNQTEPSF